jgi:hypothetical protein
MERLEVTYALQEPASSPFDFTWDVAESGHRWVQAIPGQPSARTRTPEVYLTDGHPWGTARMVRRHAPMRESPALFRTFADLEPTQEAVRRFADQYGMLGEPVAEVIALPLVGGDPAAPVGVRFDIADGIERQLAEGERLDSWAAQIQTMVELVTLWDAVTRGTSSLAERIVWYEDRVEYRYGRGWSLIAATLIDPQIFGRLRRGDLITPALMHLQKRVNERLAALATARLLWDHDREHLRLYVTPRSLLGVLWLQFARAIDGARRYLTCAQCGGWMEVSPDVRRSDARYCSGTCRTRAHRMRLRSGARQSSTVPPRSG